MIGGAEAMLKIHAESLVRLGHNVTLATLGPQKDIVKEKPVNGVSIYRMPIRNIYWPIHHHKSHWQKIAWHLIDCYNPMHHADLRRVIATVKPQVVICESIAGWSPAIWKSFKASGVPIIQFVHDQSFLCARGIMFRDGHRCTKPCRCCRLLRLGYKWGAQNVNRFVFVSKTQQSFYKECKFTRVPSTVIYNAEPITPNVKHDLWTLKRPMRLGMIGTQTEHKGLLNLIKAFKFLQGDFELYVGGNFGSDEFRSQTIQLIDNDPRIHLLGHVNADEFFSHIDLTIVPSLWLESFGLVAVESLAKQVPVVTSNWGGLTEIVRDGVNGLACDASRPEILAQTIQRIHDDEELYKRLASSAHDTIKEFVDVDGMAHKIEQLCIDVM
jgi:glycosyltransferase involved in cell wall biosynthesis